MGKGGQKSQEGTRSDKPLKNGCELYRIDKCKKCGGVHWFFADIPNEKFYETKPAECTASYEMAFSKNGEKKKPEGTCLVRENDD